MPTEASFLEVRYVWVTRRSSSCTSYNTLPVPYFQPGNGYCSYCIGSMRSHQPRTLPSSMCAAYFHKRDLSQPLELVAIELRCPVMKVTPKYRPVSGLHCDLMEGQKVDEQRQPCQQNSLYMKRSSLDVLVPLSPNVIFGAVLMFDDVACCCCCLRVDI